ncbi:hypothetical protein ES703_73368 [subsurface metagenome]
MLGIVAALRLVKVLQFAQFFEQTGDGFLVLFLSKAFLYEADLVGKVADDVG